MYKVSYINVGRDMVTKDLLYSVDTDDEVDVLITAECKKLVGSSFRMCGEPVGEILSVETGNGVAGYVMIAKMR